MRFDPGGWSVVLIGRWNPAILTPAGIAKHLFQYPEGKALQVMVPLDGYSAYLVTDSEDETTVHVEKDRLQIDLRRYSYRCLEKACRAGASALRQLPVTPVSAVGVNINGRCEAPPRELLSLFENAVSRKLTDAGYAVKSRAIGHTLAYEAGQINVLLRLGDDGVTLNCNFHLDTPTTEAAIAWLGKPVGCWHEQVKRIASAMGCELEESADGTNDRPQHDG